MPQPHTEWTLEMVHALPDDGNRYELLDGELLVSPAPSIRHQGVLFRLYDVVRPYIAAIGDCVVLAAPVDVALGPGKVLLPDLVVMPMLPDGRLPTRFEDVGRLLLVAEVTSPSTVRNDRWLKRPAWLTFGVPEYWMVDPDARIVERWRPGDTAPEVLTATLEWQPVPSRASLVVELTAIFAD